MHFNELISLAGKDVLVEIVKLAQKRGMKGSKGSWKDFLSVYDKKFGSSLSDPSRRSVDSLADFLKTFEQTDDVKFLEKVLNVNLNRHTVERLEEKSSEVDSSEQKLVRSTLEHPLYLSNYLFPSHEEGWMVTKPSKNKKYLKSSEMIAIDCEMVLCEDGTEAVVRVCAVGRNLEVKLNELVKPEKAVVDYRSEITGVTAKDLEGVTFSLTDVQKILRKLLSNGKILVGHSLNNDMLALKFDHSRLIDTSLIFKVGEETSFRRPSLNNLCKTVLGYEVRKKGAPHNCLDDASAAMKLVLAKLESGFTVIPLVVESVPETEFSKLLIHGIPVSLPSEELHEIVPGDFTIEVKVKPNKNSRVVKYSVYAIFKNPEAAKKAFEEIKVDLEKDTSGLPQKCVTFQLKSGASGSFYVRKMAHDSLLQESSKKRSLQAEEETSNVAKKLKTDEEIVAQTDTNVCDGHLKEIERLKRELSQRDKEISVLNKIVAALTRKQGL